jgi:hypothetical protein
MIAHVVVVQELVIASFNAHRINLVTGIERVIHNFPCREVLELRPNECRSLSGLHVKEFNDDPQAIAVVDAHTVLDV